MCEGNWASTTSLLFRSLYNIWLSTCRGLRCGSACCRFFLALIERILSMSSSSPEVYWIYSLTQPPCRLLSQLMQMSCGHSPTPMQSMMATGSSSPFTPMQKGLLRRQGRKSCSQSKNSPLLGRSSRLYWKWITRTLKYSSTILMSSAWVKTPLMTQFLLLPTPLISQLGPAGSPRQSQWMLWERVRAAASFCAGSGPQMNTRLGFRALRRHPQSRSGTRTHRPMDRYSLTSADYYGVGLLPKQRRESSGLSAYSWRNSSRLPSMMAWPGHWQTRSGAGSCKNSKLFSRQNWMERDVLWGLPRAKYQTVPSRFYICSCILMSRLQSRPGRLGTAYIIMSWREDPKRRVIIDSGSYTIRVGSAAQPQPQITYLNCIAIDRSTGNKLFGTQLDNIFDESKLIYEKNNVRGVTVKFEPYVNMIDDLMARMDMPRKTTGFFCENYSVTLPLLPFHPRKIMERYMEIYLEYLRFDGIFIEPSSSLIYDKARNMYNADLAGTKYAISDKYAVVVESSESATYITPFFEGKPVKSAIKRVDVGGKLLTNYLKEILSFRHLDLKNSDQLIKQIKEQMCFVSMNLMTDMRCPRNTFLKHFVMPDDELKKKGYAVDRLDESVYLQHISLDKQRFQIPEILFNPQDIGLEQKGIPDAIHECLRFAEPAVRHNYLENIILTGGNTRFSHFSQRLYNQLKKNTFNWVTPMIYTVNAPHACYEAAMEASLRPDFVSRVILKDDYRDRGPNRVASVMF